MSLAPTSIVLPSFDGTFGCFFLAAIFTSALWGVGNAQMYIYYESRATNDRLWMKCYVCVAWILVTIYEILLLKSVYVWLVSDIGRLQNLAQTQITEFTTTLFGGLFTFQVQMLFIYRAWMLSDKSYILAACLLVLSVGELAASIVDFSRETHFATATQATTDITAIRALTAVAFFTDTILALTLVVLLRKRQSEYNFARTNSMVNRIILYTISTGLVTGAFALVAFITSYTSSQDYVYILLLQIMPMLYLNSMLTSLNMRRSIRGSGRGMEMSTISFNSDIPGSQQVASSDGGQRFEIKVDKNRSFGEQCMVFHPSIPSSRIHRSPNEQEESIPQSQSSGDSVKDTHRSRSFELRANGHAI